MDRPIVGTPGGGGRGQPPNASTWADFLGRTPLAEEARRDIARIESKEQPDYMPGLTSDEKKQRLIHMSYQEFLFNTYNYKTLFDPIDWCLSSPDDRACVVGRKEFGRISIANADAAGSSHTDAAIDMAYRAIGEVVESRTRGAPSNRSPPRPLRCSVPC